MNIVKNITGSELELSLSGRLDTMTAPSLEQTINASIEGITSLVMDFKELEYISSAGLRVLLSSQKRMNKQGSMVLKNVNADIQEVFDITGFSDIITIA